MKKCPYCAEEIQDEAIYCKHCKHDISSAAINTESVKKTAGAFAELGKTMFYLGMLILVSICLLAMCTPTR